MKRLKKRTAAVLAAVMLAAAMPASSLMAQTASDEPDTITVETAATETESMPAETEGETVQTAETESAPAQTEAAADVTESETVQTQTAVAETESGAVLPESLAAQTESETAQPADIAVLAETDQGTLTADGIQQSVPTAYIEQQIADPSVSMIRIKLQDNGSQALSRDTLTKLYDADKMLSIEMYAPENDAEPYYTWFINGTAHDYNGYIPCAEQISLGVTIDAPEFREKIDGIFGYEALYTSVEMDYQGLLPGGIILSVPTQLDSFEVADVYEYNEYTEWLADTVYGAGFTDANTSYGWVLGIRMNNSYVYGGNYILTNEPLPVKPIDPDDVIYSDINEIEAKILKDAADPEKSEINVKAGIYVPNIDTYKLSIPTLEAVRDSGKVLNVTFPGVEASAEYTWTFDGSAMGEILQEVDLVVTYPWPVDEVESMITNGADPFVLNFRHSGVLPSGTTFRTGGFGGDVQDGSYGYLYYLVDSGKVDVPNHMEYVGAVAFSTEVDEYDYVHGYATISGLTRCSTYVITETRAEGPNIVYPEPEPPETDETEETEPPATDETEETVPPATDETEETAPPATDETEETKEPAQTDDSKDSGKDESKAPADENTQDTPKTGDQFPMLALMSLMLVSAAAAVVCLWKKFEHKMK